jgi:hypothetical protein
MSEKLLIQDGVKYSLWVPENEPADFEPMIKTHVKDIFGSDCMYFPKQKLKTLANNTSIPDGFVIDFQTHKWYIVELKLLSEDAINRISRQIVSYRSSLKRFENKKEIFKLINDEIGKPELHKDIYDIVVESKPEIIVLINSLEGEMGNQFKEQVEEVDQNVKILTFKTFVKQGVDPKKEHIHLFEPVTEIRIKSSGEEIISDAEKNSAAVNKAWATRRRNEENPLSAVAKFETTFTPSDIDFICVRFSRKYRALFPPHNVDFIVETNAGEIKTCITGASRSEIGRVGPDNAGSWFVKGIREWFRKNQIKTGDKVSIEVLEPGKRYKLEVIK